MAQTIKVAVIQLHPKVRSRRDVLAPSLTRNRCSPSKSSTISTKLQVLSSRLHCRALNLLCYLNTT